ncbi:MAG: 2-hydroxyacid dehydrogenase [Legionella sp.]
MKIAFFSTKSFEVSFIQNANLAYNHELVFFETVLHEKTAKLAAGFIAVSCFVTDNLKASVLSILAQHGTQLIALRSAGFNHVDLDAAKKLGLTVVRVPDYSPYAVAEFAVGLILTLNRKFHQAYHLVKEHNFLLTHLLGFDLHGKSIGIIGTGKIGCVFAKIMHGFGCTLIAFDQKQNPECLALGVRYTSLDELCKEADIISLHCPLTQDTYHIINEITLKHMKKGVMLINTSRGGLIDTTAIIQALKNNTIGYLGIDVYEEEEQLFFQDLSEVIIQDDIFTRLQSFPNVIITGHQAFLTKEALTNIASVTLQNITSFELKHTTSNTL